MAGWFCWWVVFACGCWPRAGSIQKIASSPLRLRPSRNCRASVPMFAYTSDMLLFGWAGIALVTPRTAGKGCFAFLALARSGSIGSRAGPSSHGAPLLAALCGADAGDVLCARQAACCTVVGAFIVTWLATRPSVREGGLAPLWKDKLLLPRRACYTFHCAWRLLYPHGTRLYLPLLFTCGLRVVALLSILAVPCR
jgi:hypothetical protein